MDNYNDVLRFKNFPVKMTAEMNQQIRVQAAKENVSMYQWVTDAIREKLEKCEKE